MEVKKTSYLFSIQTIIYTLRLSVLEGKFRRVLVIFNLATEDISSSTANQHRIEQRLRYRLKENIKLSQQIKKFRHSVPNIIDSLTYNAVDIIENQRTVENSLVIDFLKNIYDNSLNRSRNYNSMILFT